MPKILDRDQRRQELAEAVWRVVRREGMEHASVRNVAKEADLSTGSLRHFFSTQSDLLAFAMSTVIDRVEERIAGIELPSDPLSAAKCVLSELLPLDAERAAENEVWVAFSARAMVDEESRGLREDAYVRLRAAARRWVDQLIPTAGGVVRELESERLFALIDGLALHAAIHAKASPPDLMRAVLDHHLDQLSEGAAGGAEKDLAPHAG